MTIGFRGLAVSLYMISVLTSSTFAQNSATCPMEIDSVKQSHSIIGMGSSIGHTDTRGKLSFTYKNVSGRDIQSITIRASGSKMVGPPGGPVVSSSRTIEADGPMPANSSKKLSVKLPEGNWHSFELEGVKFSNGDTWTNDGKVGCVVNGKGGPRR